jgi:hypothetical protein
MSRLAFLALAVLLAACPKPSTPAANAGSDLANQRLHDHIVKSQRKVFLETVGADVIWSDGALIERASTFPSPVTQLHATPTRQAELKMSENALSAFMQDFDLRKSQWHAATIERKGPDHGCQVTDGTIRADVNCLYVSYFEGRYPKAKFLLKAQLEPVLLVEGDQLRGALMPVKL